MEDSRHAPSQQKVEPCSGFVGRGCFVIFVANELLKANDLLGLAEPFVEYHPLSSFFYSNVLNIKGSLEQPHGMNLNQFDIRGVWVFTHETFMLSSLLGLRCPFLCRRIFCSIFPFHFWSHKGMFWSGLESKNHHGSTDRAPFFISQSSSAYCRPCTTPPNISTPWLEQVNLSGRRRKRFKSKFKA